MSRFIKAKEDFTKAISLNHKTSEVYIRRGICNYMLGFSSVACADFKRASLYDKAQAQIIIGKYCTGS